MEIKLHDEYLMHKRKAYTIFDVLKDLGGIIYIMILICGALLCMYQRFSYNVDAL